MESNGRKWLEDEERGRVEDEVEDHVDGEKGDDNQEKKRKGFGKFFPLRKKKDSSSKLQQVPSLSPPSSSTPCSSPAPSSPASSSSSTSSTSRPSYQRSLSGFDSSSQSPPPPPLERSCSADKIESLTRQHLGSPRSPFSSSAHSPTFPSPPLSSSSPPGGGPGPPSSSPLLLCTLKPKHTHIFGQFQKNDKKIRKWSEKAQEKQEEKEGGERGEELNPLIDLTGMFTGIPGVVPFTSLPSSAYPSSPIPLAHFPHPFEESSPFSNSPSCPSSSPRGALSSGTVPFLKKGSRKNVDRKNVDRLRAKMAKKGPSPSPSSPCPSPSSSSGFPFSGSHPVPVCSSPHPSVSPPPSPSPPSASPPLSPAPSPFSSPSLSPSSSPLHHTSLPSSPLLSPLNTTPQLFPISSSPPHSPLPPSSYSSIPILDWSPKGGERRKKEEEEEGKDIRKKRGEERRGERREVTYSSFLSTATSYLKKQEEGWVLEKKIGNGKTSEVYLGSDGKGFFKVAVKRIGLRRESLVAENRVHLQVAREVAILSQVKHPHVIELYDSFFTKSAGFLVLEILGDFDLMEFVRQGLGENNVRILFSQLLSALNYCHLLGIVHRDVKFENILVSPLNNGSFCLKIADFGLANVVGTQSAELLKTLCGTPCYMAPEIFLGKEYRQSADIWSLGVVLYYMLFGDFPFLGDEMIRNIVLSNYSVPKKAPYTRSCRNFLKKMFKSDPKKRVTCGQMINHAWIKKMGEGKPLFTERGDPEVERVAGILHSQVHRVTKDVNNCFSTAEVPMKLPNLKKIVQGSNRNQVFSQGEL